MADKLEISCPFCDADYVIKHNLNKPYSMDFCTFCGENINDNDELKFSEEEYDGGFDDNY